MREDIDRTQNQQDDASFNKKVKPVPAQKSDIGIDTESKLLNDILLNAGISGSAINMAEINDFSRISDRRDMLYTMLDAMAEDSTVNAVIETYAEDATEANEEGRIVWCESTDPDVAKFITYLLDVANVDKFIYKWMRSLIVYGDVYLRLYRESEMDDGLFSAKAIDKLTQIQDIVAGKQSLKEDIKLNKYPKDDHYTHYIEAVPNPAEMYELTKYGKTIGYIKADVAQNRQSNSSDQYYAGLSVTNYTFNRKDINIYEATEFVHMTLDDSISRYPETVNISSDPTDESTTYTYTVKRGQSLLYPLYRLWRELSLLENSMLLNRLTKSSIVRMINVEVGDMPKENVGPHLQSIKNLIEQKTAINTGNSMEEYTNPGPVENNVYIPTRQGIGAITTQQVGGDIDVKGITDIDYYQDKLFGAFRAPKQYFGIVDDAAGFSGGQSLSIISSRYAKAVKRLQTCALQGLTDGINLMLLDKGLTSYINKFTLKMQSPTTQEEIDRRDNTSQKVQLTSDIMNMLQDVPEPKDRLRILAIMLRPILSDQEIFDILEEQIEQMEEESKIGGDDDHKDGDSDSNFGGGSHQSSFSDDSFDMMDKSDLGDEGEDFSTNSEASEGEEETYSADTGDELPSAADLNIDFTNYTEET